jgi:hypothetical protein
MVAGAGVATLLRMVPRRKGDTNHAGEETRVMRS